MEKIPIEKLIAQLPAGHPALRADGQLRQAALRVLERPVMMSRVAYLPQGALDDENPVRNTELFYRIADEIEYFPEMYDQNSWGEVKAGTPCGSAFCIAGHAGHETGFGPRDTGQQTLRYKWDWSDLRFNNPVLGTRDELWVSAVSSVGMYELGLTYAESSFLFNENWRPVDDYTVPEALREFGDGERISELSVEFDSGMWNRLVHDETGRDIETTGIVPD